jgi:hypothetical protein
MDRKELEKQVFIKTRDFVHISRLEGMKYTNADDFVSWIYPRISRALDRYTNKGLSFDYYVHSLIRVSAKEYCRRLRTRQITEQTWWDAHARDMVFYEKEPEYDEQGKDFPLVSNPKQVLILLLKSYHYLSDSYLRRAAPAIGMNMDDLKNMVDTLRNQRLYKDEEIRRMADRVHSQFYRCLTFEKRMLLSPIDSARRLKLKTSLEGARKRLENMRKHLASMRSNAPNWQIANIIGIPKGTVDSCLYTIKHSKNPLQAAETNQNRIQDNDTHDIQTARNLISNAVPSLRVKSTQK